MSNISIYEYNTNIYIYIYTHLFGVKLYINIHMEWIFHQGPVIFDCCLNLVVGRAAREQATEHSSQLPRNALHASRSNFLQQVFYDLDEPTDADFFTASVPQQKPSLFRQSTGNQQAINIIDITNINRLHTILNMNQQKPHFYMYWCSQALFPSGRTCRDFAVVCNDMFAFVVSDRCIVKSR